jgi:adenine-specific DNA-methyltransferase
MAAQALSNNLGHQEVPFSVARKQDNISFLNLIDAESINMVLTSPPYNIGKSYEKRQSLDSYLESQERTIKECIRVTTRDGSIFWQVGNHVDNGEVFPLDILLYGIFKSHGMKLRNRIIWHFEHGLHCSKRLSGRHETILWFTKSDDYKFNVDPIRVPSKYPNKKHFKGPNAGQLSGNPLGKNPGDVWIFPNVKANHVEKTVHPCQFPVELVERVMLATTDPLDVVLDPYMGVGSTLVAAAIHGRSAYGCDVVQEYVSIAKSRIEMAARGILPTRPMGKPIYDPSLPSGGHK